MPCRNFTQGVAGFDHIIPARTTAVMTFVVAAVRRSRRPVGTGNAELLAHVDQAGIADAVDTGQRLGADTKVSCQDRQFVTMLLGPASLFSKPAGLRL